MFWKFLKNFDLFGASVSFYYRGQSKFKTEWGSLVTLTVSIAYIAMVLLKMLDFHLERENIEYFTEMKQLQHETLDLSTDFSFAIEAIDPRVGKLVAYQVLWDGISGLKQKNEIKLESCDFIKPDLKLTNSYKRK